MKTNFFVILSLMLGVNVQRAQAQHTPQELIERLAGDTHWTAVPELSRRFGEAREEIRSGLKHTNPVIRRRLIKIIRSSHDLSFYPDLIALTKDMDAGVRGDVLQAARDWGGDSGRQIVREMLSDGAANNRGSAVSGLWDIDRTNALPEIKRIVETDSDTVRAGVAVLILAERGDRSVRGKALELTKATSFATRKNAAESLGYIGDASDLGVLKSMGDSPTEDRFVKLAAKRAVVQLEFELKPPAEQQTILNDSLRNANRMKRRWAVGILIRRGDANSLRILDEVSKDPTHPGSGEAMDALDANK